jgi:hypothetical protein
MGVLFLELNDNVRRIQGTAADASRPAAWIFVLQEKQIMVSELAEEIFALIEARSPGRLTPMEFELAHQARVAIDRIRFAIKHIEGFGPHTEQMREAGLQLLDALHRLESTDRRFQARSRYSLSTETRHQLGAGEAVDRDESRPLNQANGGERMQRRTAERGD